MGRPIRILLVEDNKVFREALELLLGLRADVEIVAAIGDGAGAAAAALEHNPDVVLMDYRLPGLDGVQATVAVLEVCPDTAVVCLTASSEGFTRPWPDEIVMDAKTKALVDKKWKELGL